MTALTGSLCTAEPTDAVPLASEPISAEISAASPMWSFIAISDSR